MTPEQKVQSAIMNWTKQNLTVVVIKGVVNTTAGWPDTSMCIDGLFVGVEIKKPGETPTPLQVHKLTMIEDAGGVGIWADSLDMFKAKLKLHPKFARSSLVHNACC